MADIGIDFDYQVPGVVPSLTQDGATCWAAAGAMMICWQKQQSMSVADAIATTGEPYITYLARRRSCPHDEIPDFLGMAGMTCEPLRSYTPQELYQIMLRYRSPLLMIVYWPNASQMTHCRVVTRVSGSGANASNCLIEYNDSLTGPDEAGFNDFYEQFEAASERPGMKGQLGHY
jgi:hypothetical protein